MPFLYTPIPGDIVRIDSDDHARGGKVVYVEGDVVGVRFGPAEPAMDLNVDQLVLVWREGR